MIFYIGPVQQQGEGSPYNQQYNQSPTPELAALQLCLYRGDPAADLPQFNLKVGGLGANLLCVDVVEETVEPIAQGEQLPAHFLGGDADSAHGRQRLLKLGDPPVGFDHCRFDLLGPAVVMAAGAVPTIDQVRRGRQY